MPDNARKITYGAMMIALFAILLAVSLYVPFIGNVTMLFIPLPVVLYRLTYDRMSSLLVVFAGVLLSLLVGGIFLIPLAFILGLVGFVIGETVKLGKTKLYIFMATGLTLLISTILMYVGAVFLFHFNFVEEVFRILREMQDQMTETMRTFGGLPENYEQMMESTFTMYENTVPSIFILGVFSIAFIIVSLNLAVARRLRHEVPTFPPFRNMKLPLATAIVYGIFVLLSLFVKMEPGSNLYLMTMNATVILRVLFLLQGISLIHYYMYTMKVPKAVTGLLTVLALLLSPMTTFLGIVDTGVNIRAWIGRDKTK